MQYPVKLSLQDAADTGSSVADFFPSSLTCFSLRCLGSFWAPLTFYVYVQPYTHRWVLYNRNC
jgi:hypothetical protein